MNHADATVDPVLLNPGGAADDANDPAFGEHLASAMEAMVSRRSR